MATQSVVFLVTFTLAFVGIVFAVLKLSARERLQDQLSEAVTKAYDSQQSTPEGKQIAADVAVVNAKAAALGGIEADEAAGRSPRMLGSWVAAHRRNVRREIGLRRARLNKGTAASVRRGPTDQM